MVGFCVNSPHFKDIFRDKQNALFGDQGYEAINQPDSAHFGKIALPMLSAALTCHQV